MDFESWLGRRQRTEQAPVVPVTEEVQTPAATKLASPGASATTEGRFLLHFARRALRAEADKTKMTEEISELKAEKIQLNGSSPALLVVSAETPLIINVRERLPGSLECTGKHPRPSCSCPPSLTSRIQT